jgi:hypothetical protein
MQLAMRPYVTAGIAIVGASVIAVTPIAPSANVSMSMQSVNLTASIDNPIAVFTPVVNAAGDWITSTIQSEIANPFPILQQIAANQITTAREVLAAAQAGAKGLGELAAGLPAALQAAGAKLAVGDVNGAIDAIISSGLNPIIGMITGIWTPLQAAFQRPFAIGQAMVPAMFDVGLSVVLAGILSTVGIGMDTGTTPFVQQIVKSTQAVLTAVTTLNPINVLNAIQHGFADVALNLIKQVSDFTTGTVPFIRDTIVRALQAGSPTAALTAAVAATTETAAAELTASAADTDSATSSPAGASTTVTPETDAKTADASAPVETVSTETVESTPVEDTIVTEPEAETVTPAVTVTEEPVKETTVPETDATNVSTAVTETTVTKGSTTVTRDSLKAEPGKSGLTSGTANGSATKTESTATKPVSEATDASSAATDSASTAASSDSGSGSDSSGSGSGDSE